MCIPQILWHYNCLKSYIIIKLTLDIFTHLSFGGGDQTWGFVHAKHGHYTVELPHIMKHD